MLALGTGLGTGLGTVTCIPAATISEAPTMTVDFLTP